MDVIELGSGVGVISCSILKKIGPEGKLLCVEGNPQVITVLRKNLGSNYPSGSASRVVHAAVDYSTSKQVGYYIDDNILGSSIFSSGTSVVGGTRTPALSLAKIYERSGFRSFALVCDIEILQYCRQIIIELHATTFEDKRYSVPDLKSDIERLGFRCLGSRHKVYAFGRNADGPLAI